MSGKKVVVTGAAGFIGYHLCRRLARDGYDVYGLDDFNDLYYDPALKRHRASILAFHGVRVHQQCFSVLNTDFLDEVDDAVVHLGAHAGVRHSWDHSVEYIENNVLRTQHMIDGLLAKPPRKVVYASTSCVMAGNPLPWKEDEPTGHQKNAYGYTKRTNECQFMTSRLPCTVGLRFFTVYGPLGRPDMALFDFTKNILSGEPITVFNQGNMVRDFTYVDDIIDGVMIAIEKTPDEGHHIYNIGRGEKVQLMDFVRHIERATGRTAQIVRAPAHPADTLETWSDTTKLRALGYDPKVSIGEGVDRFVHWYRNYYDV